MTEIVIRLANSADSESLTNFRIQEFKTAKEFELLNPQLLSYQSGHIFIVESHKQIISTMQVEKCISQRIFGEKCSTNIPSGYNCFPTFYLSKGATSKQFRNLGLNSILRKITLEYAMDDETIKSLTGVAYENAPRLHLLQNLGYTFLEVDLNDKTYTRPNGKVFFLSLERESFKKAYNLLSREVEELSNQVRIIFELFIQ